MKKLLLILCLGCTVNLASAQQQNTQQSVQDKHHTVLGYIKGGTITGADGAFLGSFKAANSQTAITDKNHNVIGYIVESQEIQDAKHHTLGFIASEGKGTNTVVVTDAQKKTLGYINFETGAVQSNLHDLIGYEINTEVAWAAPYFFFFKFD